MEFETKYWGKIEDSVTNMENKLEYFTVEVGLEVDLWWNVFHQADPEYLSLQVLAWQPNFII